MKIWEVHSAMVNGAIRTTADGDADVGGLLLSEKAYLLAMRDFRPAQLISLVEELGSHAAGDALVAHFATGPSTTGRGLTRGRSRLGDPLICRSDEPAATAPLPGTGRTH